jgi:hypothetical protein
LKRERRLGVRGQFIDNYSSKLNTVDGYKLLEELFGRYF